MDNFEHINLIKLGSLVDHALTNQFNDVRTSTRLCVYCKSIFEPQRARRIASDAFALFAAFAV